MDMHKISLADELADVRAQIGQLKLREAALRAEVLEKRGQVPDGRWARVEIVTQRAWVIDREALPEAIRANPRYWHERVTTIVKTPPLQAEKRAHGAARMAMGV